MPQPSKLLKFLSIAAYRRCLLFFLLIPAFFPVNAQSIRSITTKDGLPQSFVSGLVQDDSAFVWIGTRNGLARFDGMQYRIFQHDPYDTVSLSSNVVIWIKKDAHNALWIEHESGDIDKLDPVTEKITHFLKGNLQTNNSVRFVRRGWIVDRDSVFWGIVRNAGLNTWDAGTKKLTQFTRSNSTLPGDTIKAITETSKKQIWIVGQRSISYYDKKQDRFINWDIPYKQDYGNFSESDAVAVDLHERENGELMWGDIRNLYFFNPVNHTFRNVAMPLTGILGIRWIRTGKEGTDYLETYGKIYSYTETDGIRPVGHTIAHSFGDVKSLLIDNSGVIWLGINAKGIQQIDLETPFFQSFQYKENFASDMLRQEFAIDMKRQFDWTNTDQVFSSSSYHLRSCYDRNGRLYIALKETVCYYDSAQNKIRSLPRIVSIANNPSETGIGIKGITTLPDGSPMVITYNGKIFTYNFASDHWTSFIEPNLLRQRFGALFLPLSLYTDDKHCWITTENDGLLKLDLATKEIQQFKEQHKIGSLPSNQLLGIYPDPSRRDLLWIGSYQGLICFNTTTSECKVFSLREHLPDNTIYSILSDSNGSLWLSTNKGICKFDPISNNLRAFHTQHGLPGEEFNRFHHLRLPDGKLIFGGTDGWIRFDPLAMKDDSYEPKIAFTDLKINNKDVAVSDDSELSIPLNAVQVLKLPYAKNTVSFGFAGLEYTQPQDLLYRFKLEGYNKDWIIAGKERHAHFTKIPPGNYTLLVNASNTTGKWSPHIKALKLKILAPWWASLTAYFCYTIIISGLIWTFIRFRVGKMMLQKEMFLKEKETQQLKELDDMKSRFFSNITHEFRTPLTLILGPAEQLKAGKANAGKQSNFADTIIQNAKQLLVLINRLMDLSKLEARAMKLHEQRGNPATVVGAVVHSFENDAESRQVTLSFKDNLGVTDCWFYPDAVERIVYNLVSNALKFTAPGGQVALAITEQEGNLRLSVTDTGTGIPEENIPYIFDRYYQAGDATGLSKETSDKGTGIGLAMVKELVKQMEGSIEVDSRIIPPTGTSFVLLLPYRIVEPASAVVIPGNNIPDSPSAAENPGTATPQILLVEDNQALASFVTEIMQEHYQVTHVLNGAVGLEHALSMMPDIIISDVMMPVMDGFEFTTLVKEDIRTAHIPVILLTAKTAQEHLIEGLQRGADDYITKPFSPGELLLRVQNLLNRQQKLRERFRQEESAHRGEIRALPQTEPVMAEDIFLVKLYGLLDAHIDDSLFGVDQLAGIMNISRSSLHRKLKALTDMSTTEVVRNYRLKKATAFLAEGFTSSETAYKSGFGSPAYFTKCFRETFGMPPGEYVQKIKNKPMQEI